LSNLEIRNNAAFDEEISKSQRMRAVFSNVAALSSEASQQRTSGVIREPEAS
jgi:hypothetical protein